MAVPLLRVLAPERNRRAFLFIPFPALLVRAYGVDLDFLVLGVLFGLSANIPPFPLYRLHGGYLL